MNILHVIEGFTGAHGGIASCTVELLEALQGGEDRIELLTPRPKGDDSDFLGHGKAWVKAFDNDCKTPVGLSATAKRLIAESDANLFHVNGLWQYIDHAACAEARKRGVPYVLTPHGMLYPEALRRSAWKKWPLRRMWFDKDVREASCIHVTCEKEMENVRLLGYKGPIAIIGNPINVPDFTAEIVKARTTRPDETNGRRVIGFLGRLHPIKGIDRLLEAVALAKSDNVELVLMGSGTPEYEAFLKSEIERLGIADRVKFLGFLNGFDKFAQLGRISALFVPSVMENFGMIVLEALLVGTPVMASLGTPWRILNEEDCGWWTDNSPESIAKVIDEVAATSPARLLEMGLRGRDMTLREFEASKIAAKMRRLYHWLLDPSDTKPQFVHLG